MVTLPAPSEQANRLLIAKTMEALRQRYVGAKRSGRGHPRGVAHHLAEPTLEEICRIWGALREPYRPSWCYLARV